MQDRVDNSRGRLSNDSAIAVIDSARLEKFPLLSLIYGLFKRSTWCRAFDLNPIHPGGIGNGADKHRGSELLSSGC